MKIILHIDSLGSGGAQRQICALGLGLAARGHHVEFHTYYAFDHFLPVIEAANIPVRITQKRHRFSIAPIVGLISHAQDIRADAIVAFLRTPAVYAAIAGVFLKGTKVVTSERFAIPGPPLPMTYFLTQQLHRLADAVTVNSSSAKRAMEANFPWMAGKLYHVLNGYSLGPERQRDGVIAGPLNLLSLASICRRKDPLSLAKALRICVQDRGLAIRIQWAGEPTMFRGTCPEQDMVDAYLKAHELEGSWTWLGLVSDTDALFLGCDALIHTSLAEGFANVIAEALINSTPIIIGRIYDQVETVEKSRAGLLFDVGDPVSIADAICQFCALSPGARSVMGRNARQYAEENLSINTMIDRYEALLSATTESH